MYNNVKMYTPVRQGCKLKEARVLKRERVEKLMDNLFNYPLTIVSATMGYGKTTSVRNYLSGRNVQTVWVSLLGSDGMTSVFWSKLSAAVEALHSEKGSRLRQLGFPLDAKQVDAVINLIWKMDHSKETVLVIDDYHIIDGNKQVASLVEQIVQEGIPNLHLVLISRTRPKLNHINLLSKGLCYYIDSDTLSFTMQEIEDYFKLMDCDVKPYELEKVYRHTKGWISAVYLMMLGAKQGMPVTDISGINSLLENNLFIYFDFETQEALQRLAILDNFTMQQAVTVMENPDIPQIIKYLQEMNAFVEYDRQAGVYKLHSVLLDFLREKLSVSSLDVNDIYHRAGKWYMEQRDIITAFDYYHRVGKVEELLEYLNNLNNVENVDMGYMGYELTQKIYTELPHDLCVKYPFPFLQMARNFIISGCYSVIKQGVEIVDIMKKYYSKPHGLPEKLQNKILGELEVITVFMVFNDAKKMVEHSRKAYELLDGGTSCVIFWHNKFTFGLPHFLYTYYREPGKLKETVDCIQDGFPPAVADGCGMGCEYTALAEYALERCDIQNAEFYAKKSIYKAKIRDQVGVILCAKFTLMRLAILKGNGLEAKKLLVKTKNELIEILEKMSDPTRAIYDATIAISNATVDMCEGYIYGCLKLKDMIPEWLQNGDLTSVTLMLKGMAVPDIIRGKAVLLSENWLELEVLCESFKKDFEIYHNQLGILINSIYEAAAKFNLYGMEAGISVLLPALKDGETDGIILPFAENADFILPMLYELQRGNALDASYIEKVIRVSQEYSSTLKAMEAKNIILTERETQVLKLLVQGLTQREMAEKMYLSVSTVKRYIEHIYEKLDVNNKIAAIRKAEKMNIL